MKTIVFVKKYPYQFSNERICCKKRLEAINLCNSEKGKSEKRNVWLLLENVLRDFYKINPENIAFRKLDCGKWVCDEFEFSLSHTEDYVAVAISSKPIGVDIQKIKYTPDFRDLLLNEDEKSKFSEDQMIEVFSKKEAIFKSLNEKYFVPKHINVKDFKGLFYKDKDYVLSVHTKEKVEVINL